MKKKTKIIIIIAVLLVAAVGVSAFMSANSGDEMKSIQADLAYFDEISEIVTASGRIQPKTKVDITSEVSAEIKKLYVEEGDYVKKGTPLLLIDTIQYKSDAEQAKYSLDEIKARASSAEAQFEKDDLEYKRQKSLFDKKLTSERELIDAEFAYKNSKANFEAYQAQVKTAQAMLDKAEDNLSKTLITAPMDGVIIYLSAEAGEIAQAQTSFTQGKTLMTIADLGVYEVEVDIDETQISNVEIGQHADIRIDAFDDSVFTGTVTEIGNSAMTSGEGTEEFTTSFRVKVRCDETSVTIRPGMSATVDITTAREEKALLIPYASVVVRKFDADSLESKNLKMPDHTNGSDKKDDNVKIRGVYLVENGEAHFKQIYTGIADEQNIVALEGINPGDTVISGSFKTLRALEENDKVEIDQVSIDRMNEKNK